MNHSVVRLQYIELKRIYEATVKSKRKKRRRKRMQGNAEEGDETKGEKKTDRMKG